MWLVERIREKFSESGFCRTNRFRFMSSEIIGVIICSIYLYDCTLAICVTVVEQLSFRLVFYFLFLYIEIKFEMN